MAHPAEKLPIKEVVCQKEGPDADPFNEIIGRQTEELVLAFCGAVGSGVSTVATKLAETIATDFGYTVEVIKVSEFIADLAPSLNAHWDPKKIKGPYEKIKNFQDIGNLIRENLGNHILAQLVINKIAFIRQKKYFAAKAVANGAPVRESLRVAWIVEGLKNPSEVEALRYVYGNMFYLFGVLCPRPIRQQRLQNSKHIAAAKAAELIERDESEKIQHGQQLIKTLQLSDFFIKNSHNNIQNIDPIIKRYLELLFGKNISPTVDEFAMYMAKSASLRSACLSRQVGAAILSSSNDLITTGCNDVPKSGGGLYSPEDGSNDCRCLYTHDSSCSNATYKDIIKSEIQSVLEKNAAGIDSKDIANTIVNGTMIKDLTEYSRAVHAEMDAIVSAARNPHVSIVGGSLYATTFPCHNCARHIIASGIKKVFYIEPYEKSLAFKLHDDAIVVDPTTPSTKVEFYPFQGVAPSQYLNIFRTHGERKENGKAKRIDFKTAKPVFPQFMDTYTDYESKVITALKQEAKVAPCVKIWEA